MPPAPDSRALEHELARALTGFQVIERALTLRDGDRDVRAELAGLDELGRLWLVVVATDDTSRALLDALALLAFARANGAELGRTDGETRVAIVCERGADELARRAAPVERIHVFARETWTSASGERARLVRRTAGAEDVAETPERFVARLAEPERALAELCLARAARLGGVDVRAGADRLAWRRGANELGQIAVRAGVLSARAGRARAGAEREFELRAERDVDVWLAALLDEHLGGHLGEEELADDLPPLPETDPRPAPGGMLLTPEELAAFSS